MDANVERECSALGCLFQQIIADMKNNTPLWEDLISKATKLHTCLKTAILAITAYLEAFQKVADAATNARGATRDIGTALTRICLRHKAVETRIKTLTSAFMDCLIIPLQEKLEDWKKSLVYLDKEHAKEYKKARTELKKTSSDTLRLQKKKARKNLQQQQIYGTLPHGITRTDSCNFGGNVELGKLLESSAALMLEKRATLEETERKAVRAALLEERGRFCQFARFLKPVLDEEVAMLMELTHLQEVSDQLQKHSATPNHLPPASEQVILDVKGRDAVQWALATPPSSPSLSLGSRKSSVCSISSLTSSSSGSCNSHPSPSTGGGHMANNWHRTTSQQPANGMATLRYRRSISSGSRDSGFTSLQEYLFMKPYLNQSKISSTLPHQTDNNQKPSATSTWPDLQQENTNTQLNAQNQNALNERPHTISSAYEKGHQRPALSVYTFQAPEQSTASSQSQPSSPISTSVTNSPARTLQGGRLAKERPPIPSRCSSLERPIIPVKLVENDPDHAKIDVLKGKIKIPMPAHLAKELGSHQLLQQPTYVNMHELASLAASKAQEMHPPPPPPPTVDDATISSTKMTTTTATAAAIGISSTAVTDASNTTTTVMTNNAETKNAAGGETVIEHLVTPSMLQRRASLQQAKSLTLSAARRASSISADSGDDRTTDGEDFDNLPPPPAFLLEGGSQPSSAHSSPASQRRSVSVSETVRTLTELRHTPASPSLLRRKISGQSPTPFATVLSQQASPLARHSSPDRRNESNTASNNNNNNNNNNNINNSNSTSNQQQPQQTGSVTHSFMAALSARFSSTVSLGSGSDGTSSGQNSPRFGRKLSQEYQQNIANKTGVVTTNKSSSLGFLETLNARLKHGGGGNKQQQQQQQSLEQMNTSHRSASVRRIMANRVPVIDPVQVRDSLMDQIRRGTSLRKTSGPINDRSAPKIY